MSILNNAVAFRQRKLRKLARKRAQNTAHEHVVAVSTTSTANVTRHARARVSLAAHWSYDTCEHCVIRGDTITRIVVEYVYA